MKLLIDDANIDEIRRLYDLYPIDGVTTNPSILAKSGRQPYDVLKEIREFIGEEADLHVQVIAKDAEGMIEEALKKEGIRTTGTAIYTAMQAYLAAKSGASYTAPYVNRIDNMGYNGVGVAKEIQDIFEIHGLDCGILAASFKNSQQVLELTKYGIGAATVGTAVIEGLIKNAAITSAIDAFVDDFAGLVGEGKTMMDC